MGWLFDDAATEYAYNAAWAAVTGAPCTLAAWLYTDVAQLQAAIAISDTDVAQQGGFFGMLNAAGNVLARTKDAGGTTAGAQSTSAYPLNTWFHAAWVFTSATSRAAFLNGGSKGTNTTSKTPAGIDAIAVAALKESTVSNYFSGIVAEAALWNVALSDAEVALLGAGYAPEMVQRSGLRYYFSMLGGGVYDTIGGLLMTPVGSPDVDQHPSGLLLPLSWGGRGLPASVAKRVALRHRPAPPRRSAFVPKVQTPFELEVATQPSRPPGWIVRPSPREIIVL